jgi:hypothetical protein
MKKIVVSLFAVIAFSLTSCKDECKDVNCANGGTCNEGICTCPSGYEGELCETESRAKIVANYSVSETCSQTGAQTSTQQYNIVISKSSSDIVKVKIAPFAGYTGAVGNCSLNGTSLTLDSVTGTGIAFSAFEGSVSSNGSTISVSYKGTAGAEPNELVKTCSGTWTKQ